MSRSLHRRIPGLMAALALLPAAVAYAQSTTPPPTQDDEMRRLLGLGKPEGCFELLRVAPNDGTLVRDALTSAGTTIGNELRAICSPSAVTSASSLGGGLNTLQATKTVTQSQLPRRRIDQRLQSGSRPKPARSARAVFGQLAPSPSLTTDAGPQGIGLFGDLDFGSRDRADTAYENGYDGDVNGLSVGLDYLRGRTVVGGWIGRSEQQADFRRFGALLGSAASAADQAILSDAAVLRSVCGGLSTAGAFDTEATRWGAFAGWGVGAAGFMDATVSWARRDHEYARSVCAIESQGTLTFNGGVLRDTVNNPVDDIYAGTITGVSKIRETTLSLRAGADFGSGVVSIGPRAAFTMARGATDGFAESGMSTVANTVVPVFGNPITRTLGGPTGLELEYSDQKRTSVTLDAGAEVAFNAGPLVPHVSGYWRREFKDDIQAVTARLVQDRRSTPAVLRFGRDAYDPNALLFGFGVTAFGGSRVIARAEFLKLASDDLFESQTLSAQVRIGF